MSCRSSYYFDGILGLAGGSCDISAWYLLLDGLFNVVVRDITHIIHHICLVLWHILWAIMHIL